MQIDRQRTSTWVVAANGAQQVNRVPEMSADRHQQPIIVTSSNART
jgi:hypothetical protein